VVAAALTLLAWARSRLIGALALYLGGPIKHRAPEPGADLKSIAPVLNRGDVLLSHGSTRAAALVRGITRSVWSHVSMYVGPIEDGPDPRCIVEADIAAGVRPIRLSELDALQVRVLRPIGLNDMDRSRLADWVVSQIGSEYDLPHALGLGRYLLRLPLPKRSRSSTRPIEHSTTRFICSSLLAQAFALVGHPISPDEMRLGPTTTVNQRSVIPGDFERAPIFEVIRSW
jgi:permuted papain-like amidase YaeF/Yiix C92 family enzyme